METIGRAIAARRRLLDLTQAALGEQVGLDARSLSKIESGRTVSLLEHQLRVLRRLGAHITVEWPDATDGDRAAGDADEVADAPEAGA